MSSTSLLSSLLGSSNSSTAVDISSILEAAMGASTPGIDVTSAVSSAVTAAEAPENVWNAEITTLQSQTSDLTQIQTATTNLDNDMQALNNLTGPLSASTVASSNSSVVTATAASGSAAGNNTVVVNNLASTASFTSTTVASATAVLPSESFTITNSSGTAATITTGSGVNTLTELETAVNGAGLGVTASNRHRCLWCPAGDYKQYIRKHRELHGDFNRHGFRLWHRCHWQERLADRKRNWHFNGISSATNTVTGAIPGLTFNLLSASPATTVSLTVAPDSSAASTAINKFVTDYTQQSAILIRNSRIRRGLARDPWHRILQYRTCRAPSSRQWPIRLHQLPVARQPRCLT